MLYKFKEKLEDFIVDEILEEELSWSGDVFFVRFEKKWINTMDIVNDLCKWLHLERNNIGVAGLKDKEGITSQWICIYKSYLQKIGGEEKFLSVLDEWENLKILETNRHNTPLAVWKNKGNNFKIHLKATREINDDNFEDIRNKITSKLEYINEKWFPNCFGQQRFGKWLRNFNRAKDLFEGVEKIEKEDFHVRFKLQAYASMYFNTYAMQRLSKWQQLLSWDIMVDKYNWFGTKAGVYEAGKIKIFDYKKCKEENKNKDFIYPDFFSGEEINYIDEKNKRYPTWPMLWYNIILPPHNSKAFFRDWELIKKTEFLLKWINVAKEYNLYGIRRILYVLPQNLEYYFEWKDLIISFFLPTGCYATILLWYLFSEIDYRTCLENQLLLPFVEL